METHKYNLLTKLQAGSVGDLVKIAIRHGLAQALNPRAPDSRADLGPDSAAARKTLPEKLMGNALSVGTER